MPVKPRTRLSKSLKKFIVHKAAESHLDDEENTVAMLHREVQQSAREYFEHIFQTQLTEVDAGLYPTVDHLVLMVGRNANIFMLKGDFYVPFSILTEPVIDLDDDLDHAKAVREAFLKYQEIEADYNTEVSRLTDCLNQTLDGYENVADLLRDHPYLIDYFPEDIKTPDPAVARSLGELLESYNG